MKTQNNTAFFIIINSNSFLVRHIAAIRSKSLYSYGAMHGQKNTTLDKAPSAKTNIDVLFADIITN